MSYNAMAESYSAAARSGSPGSSKFDLVYSDIADATLTDAPFVKSRLVGELPSIAGYAPKTQNEILQVVVRDMLALGPEADGLERVQGGVYRWRFGDRS